MIADSTITTGIKLVLETMPFTKLKNKAGMLDTNFSEDPEHKCAHMFRMDDGNFFAYPNNRTVWYDDAFMEERLTKNPRYKIDQNFYTVENTREEDTKTDDSYMTQFERP